MHSVSLKNLRSGAVASCGCLSGRQKNPLYDDGLYRIRYEIKRKCYKEGYSSYRHYGGKGVEMCESRKDYYGFAEDMLGEYRKMKQEGNIYIKRKNEQADFDSSNCYWGHNRDLITDELVGGEKFGMLTYVERVENHVLPCGSSFKAGRFICSCGNSCIKKICNVKSGDTKSCGCLISNWSHGMSYTRIYRIWSGMKSRCNSAKGSAHKYYHDKGVVYDPKREKFDGFLEDMGDSYEDHVNEWGENETTLDRISTMGIYEKHNCRRARMEEQRENQANPGDYDWA